MLILKFVCLAAQEAHGFREHGGVRQRSALRNAWAHGGVGWRAKARWGTEPVHAARNDERHGDGFGSVGRVLLMGEVRGRRLASASLTALGGFASGGACAAGAKGLALWNPVTLRGSSRGARRSVSGRSTAALSRPARTEPCPTACRNGRRKQQRPQHP